MGNKYKIEIEHFDYNSKYYLPNEHRWCFMTDDDNVKEFFNEKEKRVEPKYTRVQADEEHPEKTGQWNMFN